MKTILLLVTLLLPSFSFAQSYSIDWYKVAGGGGTSTNGQYSLSGTIGQADASTTMTGGNYSVTGGFWAIYAVQVGGSPLLSIIVSNNKAVISWPTSVTNYTLQFNSSITSTNWSNYTGTVVNNTVTNTPATGNRFYRLIHN